jgi:hypothetical protein
MGQARFKRRLSHNINNYVNKFDAQHSLWMEGFKPIRTSSRLFYPRNFELSKEFTKSFKAEYDRLLKEGHPPKKIFEKISKALRFHT